MAGTHIPVMCIGKFNILSNLSTGSADRVITIPEAIEYEFFEVTTGHATNSLVFPKTKGMRIYVVNKSGQNALVKVSGQVTPVTIATLKSACLYCDGTNMVRLTPDA